MEKIEAKISRSGIVSPLSLSEETVERALVRLGLTSKEARLYLVALKIGLGTINDLAKRAGINRSTAYAVIESLLERGLLSSLLRGETRYFAPASPERLEHFLWHEEKRVSEMREAIQKIMPELATLLLVSPDRPKLRLYEGLDGLETLREDFFRGQKKFELLLISAADDYHRLVGLNRRLPYAKKLETIRGFERCIFTSARSAAELKKAIPPVGRIERYRVPEKEYPLAGEIAIAGPRVAMLSYRGKIMGLFLENQFIARTAATLFKLAWETAKKFEKFES